MYCPWQEEDPYWFLGQQVKVKFVLRILHWFRTITPLPFDLQWWYFTHDWSWPKEDLLIFGSIGQRSSSYLYFEVCIVSTDNLLTYNDDTPHTSWSWPKEDIYWFWGQRSRSNSDFKLCAVSTRKLHYLLTYNDDTSHMKMIMTRAGPLLILASIGQGQIRTFIFAKIQGVFWCNFYWFLYGKVLYLH